MRGVHSVCTVWGHEEFELAGKIYRIDFDLEFGERGGTRTLDPMIKSHVLYRLSYALTRRAV